jgi:methoxymalonate biosynthesis acyl carrier protein
VYCAGKNDKKEINQVDKRKKIREFINCNLFDITESAYFSDDDDIFKLGLVNSLFPMKLLNYIKKEFHIEFVSDDMEITNFNSVNRILEFIEMKSRN